MIIEFTNSIKINLIKIKYNFSIYFKPTRFSNTQATPIIMENVKVKLMYFSLTISQYAEINR